MRVDDSAIALFELATDQLRQEVFHVCASVFRHDPNNSLSR